MKIPWNFLFPPVVIAACTLTFGLGIAWGTILEIDAKWSAMAGSIMGTGGAFLIAFKMMTIQDDRRTASAKRLLQSQFTEIAASATFIANRASASERHDGEPRHRQSALRPMHHTIIAGGEAVRDLTLLRDATNSSQISLARTNLRYYEQVSAPFFATDFPNSEGWEYDTYSEQLSTVANALAKICLRTALILGDESAQDSH